MDILRSGKYTVRVLLFSPDIKLQSLLSSALKSEYEVLLESRKERLKEAVKESGADILVLDLDSNYATLEKHLEFYSALGDAHIPIVVISDEMKRSPPPSSWDAVPMIALKTAIPRGIQGHCRACLRTRAHEAGADTMRLTMSMTGCDRLVDPVAAQVVYTSSKLPNSTPSCVLPARAGPEKNSCPGLFITRANVPPALLPQSRAERFRRA
jgi:hypothetical protein